MKMLICTIILGIVGLIISMISILISAEITSIIYGAILTFIASTIIFIDLLIRNKRNK